MISSYNSVVITFFIVSYIYIYDSNFTFPYSIIYFFYFFLNMIFYPKYHTIPYKLIFTIPTRPINLQSFSFIRASKFKRLQAHAQEQKFLPVLCQELRTIYIVLWSLPFSKPWLKNFLSNSNNVPHVFNFDTKMSAIACINATDWDRSSII